MRRKNRAAKAETKTSGDAEAVDTEEKTAEVTETVANHEATETASLPPKPVANFKQRLLQLKTTYLSRKKVSIPATVIALLALVLLVPFSRYAVLGLAFKSNEQVTVLDSTTNTPVSGVRLQLGGTIATTSAKGTATLKLPLGSHSLTVTKQYYKSAKIKTNVTFSKAHNTMKVSLVATGRLVPITVINKITGKALANAEIKVLDTEAKTAKNGQALIALPLSKQTQAGIVTANGYNKNTVTVQVTSQTVPANTFSLTPAGSVYFLSNLSGSIDVVKTNLDGTGRKTVLPGTGNETAQSTVLLASRDWKYLALEAQRSANGHPELDLIDTSTDTMTNIDEGNADFTPVGWAGDRFIYQVQRNNIQNWQSGQGVLKSFNAQTKAITVLDQTNGAGTGPYDYVEQLLGSAYIIGNKVIYVMSWNGSDYSSVINSKAATLNSVSVDGTSKTTINILGGTSSASLSSYDGPTNLAITYYNNNTNQQVYYEYSDGKVVTDSDINSQNYYNSNNPTFLESPSGNQTFWAVPTDGKNNLLVGDTNGLNGKKIAQLSDYNPYGWFTDNYLLVSKNGSELYIMPVNGGTPQRISDYFKPEQFFRGYGGGYGGI